nr:helix-turn-helix transcriptional regulator [Streptomyces bathyalis]
MAASGMSNPAVAGHLNISVRTVSNHLQRVYDKLGVTRAELGTALALPPAPGPAAPGPGVRE